MCLLPGGTWQQFKRMRLRDYFRISSLALVIFGICNFPFDVFVARNLGDWVGFYAKSFNSTGVVDNVHVFKNFMIRFLHMRNWMTGQVKINTEYRIHNAICDYIFLATLAYCAAAAVCGLLVRRRRRLLEIVLLTLFLALLEATKSPSTPHIEHVVIYLPLGIVALALALDDLLGRRRLARIAGMSAALLFIGSSIYVTCDFLAFLPKIKPNSWQTSNAIFDVVDLLKREKVTRCGTFDWGVDRQILCYTEGKIESLRIGNESFLATDVQKNDKKKAWLFQTLADSSPLQKIVEAYYVSHPDRIMKQDIYEKNQRIYTVYVSKQ